MANRNGVVRSTEREVFWRGHVAAQARNGGSVRGYCRAHGLSESGFYFWKRELARRDALRGIDGKPRHGAGAFAEVKVEPSAEAVTTAIEVALGNARRVLVRPGFDARTLSGVIAVLEGVGAWESEAC